MPRYDYIDETTPDAERIVDRLLSLKSFLTEKKRSDGGIPDRTLGRSLLLATWNIRELGNNKKAGPRLLESLAYIAEIIAAFDIVALQEVNEDLTDLDALMKLLGPDWRYLLTDITLGRQGNGERMAFVYDGRKIHFEGLASQVVLPPEIVKGGKVYKPARQLARSPMMVGFRCNWFRFTICTAHIYYGKGVAEDPQRVEEIRLLAKFLAERASSQHAWADTMILLGDFNIFDPDDQTAKNIEAAGFHIPQQLKTFEAGETGKHYDQIAFLSPKYQLQTHSATHKAKAGVVKFFEKVFKDDEEKTYARCMPAYRHKKTTKERTSYYRNWRTFQMSDHRPMWIELPADFGQKYLGALKKKLLEKKPARARSTSGSKRRAQR